MNASTGMLLALEIVSSSTQTSSLHPGDEVVTIEARYRERPQREDLLALGRAYAMWPGHCEEARRSFERFLLACPSCAERQAAERDLEELEARCTSLVTIEAPAPVRVDGAAPVPTPVSLRLWEGPHTVTLSPDSPGLVFCATPGREKRIFVPATEERSSAGAPDARLEAIARERAAFGHLRRAEHCEAVAELERAHRVVPDPGYELNRALAYSEWPGHCTEAIEGLDRYLDSCRGCGHEAAARERREALRSHCDGVVTIEAPGFEASLDGEVVGSGLPMTIQPGRHTLALEDGRAPPVLRHFWLEPAEARTITVDPSSAWASEVVLPSPALSGAPSDESGASPGIGPIVALGIGALGAATGAVLGLLAAKEQGELDRLVEDARNGLDTRSLRAEAAERGQIYRDVANVGWATALVGGLVGLVWSWAIESGDPPPEAAAELDLTPHPDP